MADTPESLVYRGREGTGAAQIFGREGNPMRAYRERKADIEGRRRQQAEQERLQREKRDKDLWDLVNVNPDKAFEPFDNQVREAAEAHRREVAKRLEQSGGNVNMDVRLFNKAGWDKVNNLAAKSQYIKNVLSETQEAIKKDPYLDYAYYFPKINDLYLNPDGSARGLDQINTDQIRDIYNSDPMGFNQTKYLKDYFGGLNENMNNFVRQRATNNGILTEDVETTWKGDVYTRDPNSSIGVKKDANGNPILNVTTDMLNSIMNSDRAKRFYDAQAAQRGVPVDQVVREAIAPHAGLKTNVRPSFRGNQSWYWDQFGSGLKPQDRVEANKLWENVGAEVNAFINPDGTRRRDASPEARAAAGHMIGNKSGGGTVKEVEFISGTNKPGKSAVFGKSIDNSPNDRMIRKVQLSNGRIKLEEIDLTDEGAGTSLWTLHRDGGYFGKKRDISFDQAAADLKFDPTTLYQGREYVGVNREREQAKVNAWAAGNDYQSMKGKMLDGVEIESVEPLQKGNFWNSKFGGYRLKMQDGSVKEIPDDDIDSMTDIYRSGDPDTEVVTTKKKDTKVGKLKSSYKDADGNAITLDQLRKAGYSDERIQEAIKGGYLE